MRRSLLETGLLLLCMMGETSCSVGKVYKHSVYKDFGGQNDVSPTEKMYFEIRGPDWSSLWYLDWPAFAPYHTAFFEDRNDFWWVGVPPHPASTISARTIMFRRQAALHVKSAGFSLDRNLYLTIRYKDQCRPGDYPGVPVYRRFGRDEAVKIGIVGGKDDKRWKTETLVVSPDKRQKTGEDFIFVFGSEFQDQIIGELPIDKIKLSEDPDRSEFELDAPGLWPKVDEANLRFKNIGKTNEYIPGQGAFFPFGFYSGDQVSDGGSAKSGGHGKRDSWEIMQHAHVNTYVLHGWEENWYSDWKTFPAEMPWAAPGVYVEPGFKEFLVQARDHNIKVIPNDLTDTRAYWIRQDGGSPATLRRLAKVAATYKGDPTLLAYNPVDEFDHTDVTYTKPHLYVRQLFKIFKDNDPSRPVYMTLMGYMGPKSWQLAAESADILATDTYLDDYAKDGGLEHGASLIANRLDVMRSVLKDSKALLYVAHFGEGPKELRTINGTPRLLNATEILFEGYLGIVHGAQGVIYFRFIHPDNPKYPNLGSTWQGFRQMGEELFGKQGLAPVLIAPSVTEDIMGEKGAVACDNPDIHFILKRTADGRRFLIAVNVKEAARKAKFTFKSPDRARIEVRFENRNLTLVGGSFSDSFGRFDRHVYLLK